MLNKSLNVILLIGWVAVITVLSLVSFNNLSTQVTGIPYADKLVHLTFYAVLTLLLFRVLNQNTQKKEKNKNLWLSASLAFGYGIIIEVLQETITVFRTAEISDVLSNLCGVLLACVINKVFYIRPNR